MPSSVYVETSVISYYTARPSRDIVTGARQTLTQEWWDDARGRFDLYVSVLVVEEAKGGGAEAAQRRPAAVSGLPIWRLTTLQRNWAGACWMRELSRRRELKTHCIFHWQPYTGWIFS